MFIMLLIFYVSAGPWARKEFVLFLVLYESIQLCQWDTTAAQKLVSILSGNNNTGAIFAWKIQVSLLVCSKNLEMPVDRLQNREGKTTSLN